MARQRLTRCLFFDHSHALRTCFVSTLSPSSPLEVLTLGRPSAHRISALAMTLTASPLRFGVLLHILQPLGISRYSGRCHAHGFQVPLSLLLLAFLGLCLTAGEWVQHCNSGLSRIRCAGLLCPHCRTFFAVKRISSVPLQGITSAVSV